jgi:hypothetical protein
MNLESTSASLRLWWREIVILLLCNCLVVHLMGLPPLFAVICCRYQPLHQSPRNINIKLFCLTLLAPVDTLLNGSPYTLSVILPIFPRTLLSWSPPVFNPRIIRSLIYYCAYHSMLCIVAAPRNAKKAGRYSGYCTMVRRCLHDLVRCMGMAI